MWKLWTAALAGAVLFVLLAPAAFAQSRPRRVDQAAPEPSVEGPLTLEGAFVEVPVVVADRSGHYIVGLTRDDFVLVEDGVRQEIASFRPDRVPIHVVLLMDTSSSTRDSLRDIQEAAADFLDQLLPGDEVMIVSFSDEVRLEQEFTSDRTRLKRAIERTETRSGTKLYDAVYQVVGERLRRVEGRKAVILLSDGEDSRSSVSFEDAVNACVESDVTVYGIRYPHGGGTGGFPFPGKNKKGRGFPRISIPRIPRIPGVKWPLVSRAAPGTPSGGSHFMEVVTRETGGALHRADAVGDLEPLFRKIAEELRHVYVLGYSPSNPLSGGGYRQIRVEVPTVPDAAVRHRLGYGAGAYHGARP